MKKTIITLIILLCVSCFLFRLFCGIFVIQPIGAIPKGVTVVYWRAGLNMPFIASSDGLLIKSGTGVSLLGRGMVLSTVVELIEPRIIFRLPYFEVFYLISTGGKQYSQ